MKSLKTFSTRPTVMETILCHGNDGDVEMHGEYRRALLEFLRRSFNGALTLGIHDEDFSSAQAVGSGAHGRHQI